MATTVARDELHPRYELYADWLVKNYDHETDPEDLQIAVRRYHEFQASEENKAFNLQRKQATQNGRDDLAEARAAKKAAKKAAKAKPAPEPEPDEDEEEEEAPAPRKTRRTRKATAVEDAAPEPTKRPAKKTTRRGRRRAADDEEAEELF